MVLHTPNPVTKLKEAFEQRKKAFCLRSSCVFPVYVNCNKDTDTFLVCHNEKNGSVMGDHGF